MALKALGSVIKTTTGQVITKKVGKESCSVCRGLFEREHFAILLCEGHQTEYLMKHDMRWLMDPANPMRIKQVDKDDCSWCKTGKSPEG